MAEAKNDGRAGRDLFSGNNPIRQLLKSSKKQYIRAAVDAMKRARHRKGSFSLSLLINVLTNPTRTRDSLILRS